MFECEAELSPETKYLKIRGRNDKKKQNYQIDFASALKYIEVQPLLPALLASGTK